MKQLTLFNGGLFDESDPPSKSVRIAHECYGTGEPFFVLRAKDIFSVMAVRKYAELVESYGPIDYDFQEQLEEQVQRLRDWQVEHPHDVKYPD